MKYRQCLQQGTRTPVTDFDAFATPNRSRETGGNAGHLDGSFGGTGHEAAVGTLKRLRRHALTNG